MHGKLKSGSEASVKVVRDWLKERYNTYTDSLVDMLASADGALQVCLIL